VSVCGNRSVIEDSLALIKPGWMIVPSTASGRFFYDRDDDLSSYI